MMRTQKRQRQMYLFAGVVAAIAIVNLLFFLILYRPTRSEYFRLRDSIGTLRSEIAIRRARILQKENTSSQLDTSNQDRQAFVTRHLIPVTVGYAKLVPELDQFARNTGARWTLVNYAQQDDPQYGLYSIRIQNPVQGSYSGIVKFIKEIEESETLYIITSVDVRSSSDNSLQQGAGSVSLSLGLETFFYQ